MTVNRVLAIAALVLAIISLLVAGPLLAAACICLALAYLI